MFVRIVTAGVLVLAVAHGSASLLTSTAKAGPAPQGAADRPSSVAGCTTATRATVQGPSPACASCHQKPVAELPTTDLRSRSAEPHAWARCTPEHGTTVGRLPGPVRAPRSVATAASGTQRPAADATQANRPALPATSGTPENPYAWHGYPDYAWAQAYGNVMPPPAATEVAKGSPPSRTAAGR